MAKQVEDVKVGADRYRLILSEETENTRWRHGGPPIFDAVNKLFEEGRTKSREMELSHKTRLQDFKTLIPEMLELFVNGRDGLSGEETLRLGSYNALLQNSPREGFQYFKADKENYESSQDAFRSAFYSGPPVIAYKFRHWGYFEGPFKEHAPTGEMVEFYAELFGGLLKGKPISKSDAHEREHVAAATLKLLKMDVPSQQEK
ncbi:hypothetical protein ACJRO7_025139 [Eucalyptus globulus]|uniref:Uncharacterized protein n=1 Tax=Eucalyptus globulus TaxID=34317 RepID=A0ABD3K908_EUCGL